MAFEDKEAELGLLLTQMQNEPDDLHELYEQIRQKLNEMKAYGMPLPADLVQFEHDLEAEFAAEKRTPKGVLDSITSSHSVRSSSVDGGSSRGTALR